MAKYEQVEAFRLIPYFSNKTIISFVNLNFFFFPTFTRASAEPSAVRFVKET